MPYSVQQVIMLVAPAPLVIAFGIGLARFRHLDQPQRYLVGLLGFSVLMELVSKWLWMQKKPNLFLAPLDTLVEFSVLAWMYRAVLRPSVVSRLIPAVVVAFGVSSLLSYAPQASIASFNPVQRLFESVLVLLFVLLYFYQLSRADEPEHLEGHPMFWVSAGLLVYFAGNVLIFLASDYLLRFPKALNIQVWTIHALLYMLLCGCYSLALWRSPRSSK